MITTSAPTIFWALAAIQVLGLSSACLARLSEGFGFQSLCQFAFFGCLALVATATVVSSQLGPNHWHTSGITLAVMVVLAVCDFRRGHEAVTG